MSRQSRGPAAIRELGDTAVESMTPPVSIVLPTLDESAFIRDCLDSLLSQDYPGIAEILVVDGGSRDGTREIAKGMGARVRVVDNPRVTAAAAMNIGIQLATTDIIVRADAHTLYEPDYVSSCVAALLGTGAVMVGGPMRPVGMSPFGRAVAAVTSSPFGVGPGRFHYSERLEEVDTVYLGAFDRQTVIAAGGYDELNLQWAAEDQELNFRLRQRGGRILLDPAIRSQYFPRQTARALLRQYHNYGMCKASTFAKHKTIPHWRPLVPGAMVGLSVSWIAYRLARRQPGSAALPLVVYAGAAGVIAARLSRQRGVTPHRVVVALAICHWGYGVGLWRGVARILSGRPFDARPKR
jgi:glycosyltransferase involved in cell wall biosynthesis